MSADQPQPAPASPGPQGFYDLPRRTMLATLGGVMVAMLMAALDQTIVGTAMPRVIADLQGFEHYAGVLTAYMVASTVAVPITGKLSDLYGRKPFLMGGVALFILASAACGAAQSMNQLIAFRGVQGLAAGTTQAMAFTTIADLFPPARRGRVSGVMGTVFGLASVIGPSVGGLLTDGPGWRYVFYVNVPVGLLALGVLWVSFPTFRIERDRRPRIDYWGALTLTLAVVSLLLAISWGGRDFGWASPVFLGMLALGAVMTVAFLIAESAAPEPIIPLRLFREPIVSTSLAAAALVAVGMFGATLFIPLFIQAVVGTSATRSGAVLTPMMLGMITASMTSGQLVMRWGRYRSLAIAGVSLTTVGMFLLSRMDVSTHYLTVVTYMVVLGLGLGATMPLFSLAVQNAVDVRVVGTATAMVQFLRSIGGALGAALFGAVLVNRFVPGFHGALPAELLDRIPPAALAKLDNPQLLMTPGALENLALDLAGFGAQAQSAAAAVLGAVRVGLATALHDMFLLGTALLVVATLITLRLKEIPLRRSNRPADATVPTAPSAPSAPTAPTAPAAPKAPSAAAH